jgi:mutator protein MutT
MEASALPILRNGYSISKLLNTSTSNLIMITVAVGIIQKNDEILLAQRYRKDSHGFKWEFPGGTLQQGESGEDGIVRELMEELNLLVEIESYFGYYSARYKP